MRLSTKSRYGVRALFDIAYHSQGAPAQIKEISRRQGITPRYLEQIFQRLKRAGIITSIRGPKGGYYLSRKPDEIVLSEIVEAMDESIDPVFCAADCKGRRKRCRRESKCVAQAVWRETGQRIREYWDSISLSRMCRMAAELGFEGSDRSAASNRKPRRK
ncbi:MAG TPA: RrF2 family transcriptional regulator [Thermodesulfobacteriota bacterium]|nr:RrF2 family transcriptional regulator [Thermodesulfobacteriota bacterium]